MIDDEAGQMFSFAFSFGCKDGVFGRRKIDGLGEGLKHWGSNSENQP